MLGDVKIIIYGSCLPSYVEASPNTIFQNYPMSNEIFPLKIPINFFFILKFIMRKPVSPQSLRRLLRRILKDEEKQSSLSLLRQSQPVYLASTSIFFPTKSRKHVRNKIDRTSQRVNTQVKPFISINDTPKSK